jgi:hypothetical protein
MKSTLPFVVMSNGDVFVVRFTVQSSLGWRKLTLRFIVENQGFGPRIFDVNIKETFSK